MSDTFTGRVVAVNRETEGDVLAADLLAGVGTIVVEDGSEFGDSGFVLIGDDAQSYSYTVADPENAPETLTILPATRQAFSAGDLVILWDPATGAPITEVIAQVAVEGSEEADDALEAVVDHSLIPFLPEGIRDEASSQAEAVTLEWRRSVLYVVNVEGREPVMDGSVLTPGTVPLTPSAAPSGTPTVAVAGGIRSLIGTLTTVTLAAQYDVYLSTSNASTPDAAHKVDTVSGSQFQITRVPDVLGVTVTNTDGTTTTLDTRLQHGVTYYVAAWAKNELGSAPAPSAWVAASLVEATTNEIDADIARIGDITVDNLQGGTLSATVNLAGRFTTRGDDPMAPGGEFDVNGIRGYGIPDAGDTSAPLAVNIPFDGSPALFSGDVEAQHFTSYDGADLYGDANNVKAGGGLYLESGSGGAISAPTITQTVPGVKLAVTAKAKPSWNKTGFNPDYTQMVGFSFDAVTGYDRYFIVVQNTAKGAVTWRVDMVANTIAWTGWEASGWEYAGFVYSGASNFFALARPIGGTNYGGGNQTTWINGFYTQTDTGRHPSLAIGQDGTVRIAENVSGKLQTANVNNPFSNSPSAGSKTTASSAMFSGANTQIGSFELDTDGSKVGGTSYAHVLTLRNVNSTIVRVAGTVSGGLVETTAKEWMVPAAVVGVAYSRTLSGYTGWYALGMDGTLYRFVDSNVRNGFQEAFVAGVTMATDTQETAMGSRTSFNMKSRWQTTIQGPQLVTGATREGVYLYQGSGNPTDAQMHRQGYTANTGTNLTITSYNASGTAPKTAPTAGAFPTAAPAFLQSQALEADGVTPSWQLKGDGSFKLGKAGTAFSTGGGIQFGSFSASMGGASNVSGTVTFPKAFGSAPIVVLTVSTSATNKLIASVNNTVSATSFAWTVKTGDGTTSSATPTVNWIAIGG